MNTMDMNKSEKEINDKIMNTIDMWSKSKKEINDMCNSGMFNDIIKGYCIIVCKELGVSDEDISNYSFYKLFDFVGAEKAREKAEVKDC